MPSKKQKKYEERIQALRNHVNENLTGKRRESHLRTIRRAQLIADLSDEVLECNDTDQFMIYLLLTKYSYPTLRKRIYRTSKAMGLNTESK